MQRKYDFLHGFMALLTIWATIISLTDCEPIAKDKREVPAQAITQGLEAGKAIAELIEKKEFTGTLTKIATSIGPYLGAIGPFVGFILAFIPSAESAELKYMKQMMKDINNRFDKIDARFYDIERLIVWTGTKINFAQIEQKIVSLSEDFRLFYDSPKDGRRSRRDIYVRHYENSFDDSAVVLYEAVKRHSLFQDELGYAVMKYTKYNRADTQLFMLGVMKLLLQAVKLELVYYHMKYPHLEGQQKNVWASRMKEVKTSYEQIDAAVKNKYHDQSGLEMNDYLSKYYKHSNQEFASAFYNFLSKKYYWRDWIVISYDPITGDEVHQVSFCGGHIKFREKGRNIGIGSVDKTHPRMNIGEAQRRMSHVTQSKTIGHSVHQHQHIYEAKEVLNSLDKSGSCASAVIRRGHDLHVSAASGRLATYFNQKYFDILMWG